MSMEKGSIIMKIQAVLIDGFKNLSNVRINFDNMLSSKLNTASSVTLKQVFYSA